MAALAIFVLVYGIILAGENSPRKLDRPAAGMAGGVLMVLCGVLTRKQALDAIDFSTLALLLGMMILVHFATECGLLDQMAQALVRRSHTARQLLWTVCFSAGVLSALFVNDTICLLMTPLLLAVTRRSNLPPAPYLLALATSSNVGSVMTLTGNPQNMLIGQSSGWAWGAFALRMAPVGLLCLAVNAALLAWLFRRELSSARVAAPAGEDQPAIRDRRLAVKTLAVMAGLLIAFLCGAPMDLTALAAAVVMLALANRPPQEAFNAVDWGLLLFFAGLFVVVEGVTRAGGAWLDRVMPLVIRHSRTPGELAGFSGLSVLASNLFSNVPYVMLIRGWLHGAPGAPLLWLVLAMASTFAGNLTLVGSVANLIVAQRSAAECQLSFREFLRVGIPVTLATVTLGVGMLWLFARLGFV